MSALRGWLRGRPWRIYPLVRTGWRYHNIYRAARRGSWNPFSGRWLSGGEPQGRLRALWTTASFPHVHDEGEA